MSNIRRPFISCIGVPGTGSLIQCVNGREPQIQELSCWDIYGIFGEVHPTARVDIPYRTVREFFTEYISENGRRKQIIGELFINGSVQFMDLLKYGVGDCRILSIVGLMLSPKGGALVPMEILVPVPLVPALSLETRVVYFLIPQSIGVENGVDQSIPVLLIFH